MEWRAVTWIGFVWLNKVIKRGYSVETTGQYHYYTFFTLCVETMARRCQHYSHIIPEVYHANCNSWTRVRPELDGKKSALGYDQPIGYTSFYKEPLGDRGGGGVGRGLTGMLLWRPLLGLLMLYPFIQSNYIFVHCNTIEDQVHVDFTYGSSSFNWVEVTWQRW